LLSIFDSYRAELEKSATAALVTQSTICTTASAGIHVAGPD
jgi:hypothetical protein